MSQVATLIANPSIKNLTPEMVNHVSSALGANETHWLGQATACDLTTSQDHAFQEVRPDLESFLADNKIDLVIQNAETRRKKVLIADMDSTMIDQECIDELAAEVGIKDKVAAITARAMNGEIEFEDAINERVALLKGLDASVTDQLIETRITLASGGKTLVQTMKQNGCYSALVSGGFTSFTSVIASKLGFDENRANVLEIEDGKLAGTVQKPILGAQAKVEALQDIAEKHGLAPEDFIAVGDGANDLPMLKLAGTGVALHAKPSVAAQAKCIVNHGDLTALLYIQGYQQSDFAY